MCAIFGSSVFLSIATRNGLPISTTQSILGGILGDGVFAAWIVAPGLSGVLGAGLFLVTKKFVLTKTNAVRKAFYSIPFYTFLTFGALTMLMAWKGVQTEVELTPAQILIAVFSVATGATSLQAFFILPYLWRKIVNEDWQLAYVRASETLLESIQTSQTPSDLFKDEPVVLLPSPALALPQTPSSAETVTSRRSSEDIIPPRPAGPWNSLPVLLWRLNRLVLRGLEKDVVSLQKRNALLSWDIEDMHARAPHYDNRAEYMYSALQILTASTASFIHGANDVANSIGPFATAYDIWRSGRVETAVGVPLWILCFGGGAIVLGLLTYGYHPRVRDGAGERDYGADGNAAGVAGVDDAVYRGRDGGCWACEWGLEVY
uniref:Phosphate transporter n=1 Tax=Colletotrichum fructicola (strain Nara gc5) TaxID=1213859 RepID=L2FMU5_COLFN